jgi:hypothetical protein
MTKHKSGCPALGGYGHGVEPCICGADQIGIDKQENKPSTDDLIAYQKQLLENYQANPVVYLIAREILETLRDYKRIMGAKVPEPVAHMWQHGETGATGFLSHAPDDELKQWERMNKPRKIISACYGPEVLDILRRETAKNQKLTLELQSLLSQSMEKESEIKRIKELLREAYEVYAQMEGIPTPQTACEAYLLRIIMEMQKPLSAALLAGIEKEMK